MTDMEKLFYENEELVNYCGIRLAILLCDSRLITWSDKGLTTLSVYHRIDELIKQNKASIELIKFDRTNKVNKERQDLKNKIKFHRTMYINNLNLTYKDVCKNEKVINNFKKKYLELGKELSKHNEYIQGYENKIKELLNIRDELDKRFKALWDKELPSKTTVESPVKKVSKI